MTVSEHKYFTKWFNASAYSCLVCCCTSCRLELSDPKALIHFSSSSGFSLQISGPPHASFTMDLLINKDYYIGKRILPDMFSAIEKTGSSQDNVGAWGSGGRAALLVAYLLTLYSDGYYIADCPDKDYYIGKRILLEMYSAIDKTGSSQDNLNVTGFHKQNRKIQKYVKLSTE
ncbi:unnamed protein product [Clavelina lepadiformis]|uniref:Uncharacterized protein n=1 Tax=Clavelina lepadiformis TaxID=159417 RepID=A0ABP0GX12_CLALP